MIEYSQNYSTNHTVYICVPVTSLWMMKPSQNVILLLQLHLYLQKGAKCESGKYRPVSSLVAFFLSLWNFRDRKGINPLNSINILAWEQFRSGKHLLEVTILHNCVHVILWTLNNETYCSALFCDLVRHFWLEIMTVLFDKQSGLCSEFYHNDGKQGAYILSLNSHCN